MDLLALFKAAMADQEAGRLADAEQGYRRLLGQVFYPPAAHNLALILEATGRFEEATACYRRAAEAAPDNPKRQEALGNHLFETRQLPQAVEAFRKALELDPGRSAAATGLGSVLLALGRLEEGWVAVDQRRARLKMLEQGLSIPEWRGQSLAGKRLFVWREQGYGDQIMLARFLGKIDALAVTYAGPPALQRLFSHLPAAYIAANPKAFEVPPHDYWSLPLSLPRWLGVTPQTLPNEPYLFGRPTPSPTAGRIGIVFRGEPSNRNDKFRSIPSELAAQLLALPGAVSLDPKDTGAADFQATADIIAGLDLVITVDTAVAHLAGAMGAPVWVLLGQQAIDWHWPREGVSPWYPQARLFVQPSPGDWAGVIAAVRRELAALGFS